MVWTILNDSGTRANMCQTLQPEGSHLHLCRSCTFEEKKKDITYNSTLTAAIICLLFFLIQLETHANRFNIICILASFFSVVSME